MKKIIINEQGAGDKSNDTKSGDELIIVDPRKSRQPDKPVVKKPSTGNNKTDKGAGDNSNDTKSGGEEKKDEVPVKGKVNLCDALAKKKGFKSEKELGASVRKNPTLWTILSSAYYKSNTLNLCADFLEEIANETTASNINESLILSKLSAFLSKGSVDVRCKYLDWVIRMQNPASTVYKNLTKYRKQYNILFQLASGGRTVDAISSIPIHSSIKTLTDLVNPASQFGDWLDTHDIQTMSKFKGIVGTNFKFERTGDEYSKITFTAPVSTQTLQKIVLTIYEYFPCLSEFKKS